MRAIASHVLEAHLAEPYLDASLVRSRVCRFAMIDLLFTGSPSRFGSSRG